MTRLADWIGTCASLRGSPQLCAIALITAACSGCGGQGNTPAKPSYREIGCRGGVCIKLIDVEAGMPTGLSVPVTVGGVSHSGTSQGYVVTGRRTTVWVDIDGDGHVDVNEDANGNGMLDPGEDLDEDGKLDVAEPVIQNADGAVAASPPTNTGGAPPFPGPMNAPRPTNAAGTPVPGNVKLRVRVQVEVSEFGEPPRPIDDIEREFEIFVP